MVFAIFQNVINNFLNDFSWLKHSKKKQHVAKTIVFTMEKHNILTKKIIKKITKNIFLSTKKILK